MRGNARRAPVARAALGAVVAAVVATGLLGLENAQADPQPSAPAVAATPVLPGPAAPAERTPAAEPAPRHSTTDRDREDVGRTDRDAAGTTADADTPSRVGAAAPRAPQTTSQRPEPPADPSEPAGSKPTGQNAPVAPVGPTLAAGTPCMATVRACVALADRKAWLLDGGKIVRGPVRIQHGDFEDPTPRGTFHVQWKAEQYTSREYLTQMPYSVFFADGGIAFHEGAQDTPSAGCVKLVQEDAKAFFYFLQVGDQVQIH
jgi:lipoprotein-anchoring transpeptidase ErfK/SrfK